MQLEVVSPHDGSARRAYLRLPVQPSAAPLPLVLAPHPFGWRAEEDYAGGMPGLKRGMHRGWHGIANRYGVAVLQPMGHARELENVSLGYAGQIIDFQVLIEAAAVHFSVDRQRIYAVGLSMGGQEALLLAARYPTIAAVFTFNPIVDLAAWHDDLLVSALPAIKEYRTAENIRLEVGGSPTEVPDAYLERSPSSAPGALVGTPVAMWWSAWDSVVTGGVQRQAFRLYQRVKSLDATAPITEYEHTLIHGKRPPLTLDEGWAVHEYADYELALSWCLQHRLLRR